MASPFVVLKKLRLRWCGDVFTCFQDKAVLRLTVEMRASVAYMADGTRSSEKIVCLGWHGITDRLTRKNIHCVSRIKNELLLVVERVTEKE